MGAQRGGLHHGRHETLAGTRLVGIPCATVISLRGSSRALALLRFPLFAGVIILFYGHGRMGLRRGRPLIAQWVCAHGLAVGEKVGVAAARNLCAL